METEMTKEHEWLQQLVGDWTYDIECDMGPDKPAEKSSGTEQVRSLGGLWVVAEGQSEMPGGGPATTLMTLGFDPQNKRYLGTWVGSMMTHMWIYDGALDASGKVLTLDTEGPTFAGDGKFAKYQDVIEIISADQRRLSSRVLREDGQWHSFMSATYRRRT